MGTPGDVGGVQLDMVELAAGEFIMGDDGGLPDQRPAHRVRVSAFRIARFAVTRSEYQAFCARTGTPPPPCWGPSGRAAGSPLFAHARQPAVGVTWHDAVAYAAWLSALTGRLLRLPTEAERERATRGLVDGRRYPWGDDSSPDGRPTATLQAPGLVDTSLANPLGIRGLADGVHEWCLDWYAADWYRISPFRDPSGPTDGTRRVSRGGSWRHHTITTPCAARSSLPPHMSYTDYGFRLVEAAVPTAPKAPPRPPGASGPFATAFSSADSSNPM
jgi:formylglycine-generating enzyme required for sulfatase activity